MINIIQKYINKKKNYTLNNIIFTKLKTFYEELNNINLIHLNKLKYYWCINSNTNELYLYDFIINKKKRKSSLIKKILKNLDIDRYKYIIFHISTNKINNNIYNFRLNKNNYYLLNFTIKDIIVKQNNKIKWNLMIPASSVRNYILDDPLLDFLKEYNIHSLKDKPSKIANSNTCIKRKDDDFTEYIKQAGIKFEDELYKIIDSKHKTYKVADAIHAKNINKFKETIELMKNGMPIIYQGVLHNYDNKTYGIPDLLVRSDYINKLMGYNVIDEKEAHIKSNKLKTNYHYKVIDIKHSTIYLKKDGEHILNVESIPAYKSQLYIYTLALNKILGININKAFIWGKKYKINKYENNNFMNKLGIINYDNNDIEFIEKTNNAINWIKELRLDGSKWTLLPKPCRSELYPNMKNKKDGQWHNIKKDLNKYINEITDVWYCSVKKRKYAHEHNIFSWKDKACNAEILGFSKNSKYDIINGILNINQQNKNIIKPDKIIYDRYNWDNLDDNILEFYFDFETLNSNFGSIINNGIISYDNNQYIFLIGLGYIKDNEWKFKNFIMDKKTDHNENIMFDKFFAYIDYLLKINKKKYAKLYHWSQAEVIAYKKYKNKNNLIINDDKYIFYDLYNVFIKEPILIKNALNFSLKTIAKTLYEHNLIKSTWDTQSPCSNGLNAMILANKLYEKNINIYNEPIMKEIIYYNEIDCKVMYEIHLLIKKY